MARREIPILCHYSISLVLSQEELLTYFSKVVLASRTKPPQAVVVSLPTKSHSRTQARMLGVEMVGNETESGCLTCWSISHTQATCGPLFKKMNHHQFSSLLLPATLKCLLRNPDELLEGKNGLRATLLLIERKVWAWSIGFGTWCCRERKLVAPSQWLHGCEYTGMSL